MPHEYAGHYSTKHPEGTSCDPTVAAALRQKADGDRVPCAVAHALATSLGVPPSEVGKTADLLEYRVVKCQLGLFGYAPEKRIVKAASEISDELRDRLQEAAVDGRISCVACWEIAKILGMAKMDVSAGCELLGLKVANCQLGAF